MSGQQGSVPERVRCNCGGLLEAAVVPSYRFADDAGRGTVVHHVPAAICARCGDIQIDPVTLARIQRTLRRVDYQARQPEHLVYAAD